MELDSLLLEELDPSGPAILHLYDWERPSFTFGYFVKPERFLDMQAVSKLGLDCARRPTGGGIVFHTTDLAFSVLIPASHEGYSDNILENYRFINEKVKKVIQNLFAGPRCMLLDRDPQSSDEAHSRFCMAKPTIYDVMLEGKKIAGSAQRKRRQGYLHQGSLSLCLPDETLLKKILLPTSFVLESMIDYTEPFIDLSSIAITREKVKEELKKIFS